MTAMDDERGPEPTTPAPLTFDGDGNAEQFRSAAEIAAIVVPIATAAASIVNTVVTQKAETAREVLRQDGATGRAIIEANQPPPQDPPA